VRGSGVSIVAPKVVFSFSMVVGMLAYVMHALCEVVYNCGVV
jgi:hypothetical protein